MKLRFLSLFLLLVLLVSCGAPAATTEEKAPDTTAAEAVKVIDPRKQ